MDMRNCVRCGKLFSYSSVPICEDCVKLDEEDFQKVRAYIKENPGVGLHEVSEATEVSVKRIAKYIRDGKIENEVSDFELHCEKCGKPIKSGKMCQKCVTLMTDAVESVRSTMQPVETAEKPKTPGTGMHIFK